MPRSYTFDDVGYIEFLPSGSVRAIPKVPTADGRQVRGKPRTFSPKHGETELDAQNWLQRQRAQRRADDHTEGVVPPQRRSRMLFAAFAYQWERERHEEGQNATRRSTSSIVRFLAEFFDGVTIEDLTRSDVRALLHTLEEKWKAGQRGGAPGTQRQRLNRLRMILDSAVRQGRRFDNPARTVSVTLTEPHRLANGEATNRVPSEAESLAVIEQLPEWLQAGLFLALDGGWRVSEIAALQMNQLDLLHRTIEVGNVDDFGTIRGHTKNGERKPMALTPRTARVLGEHVQRYGPTEAVFVNPWTGNRVRPQVIQRRWKQACVRAGLAEPLPTPHSLRHACATILVSRGVPVEKLREYMRHGSLTTTQQYFEATRLEEMRSIIDAAWGQSG